MSSEDTSTEALFLPQGNSMQQLIDTINPTIYESLKSAIALGKWENGTPLSPEQSDYCMQALILYEARHFAEQQRTGANLRQGSACADETTVPVTLRDLQSGDGQ